MDVEKLRELALAAKSHVEANSDTRAWQAFERATTPSVILALLDRLELLEREAANYHRMVTAQLHYDMKSLLTGTPEERARCELDAMRSARDEACDLYDRLAAGAVCDDERVKALRQVGSGK